MPTIIASIILTIGILGHAHGFWETIGFMVSMIILSPVAVAVYVFSRWMFEVKSWS